MEQVLTAAQMRALEKGEIESGRVSGAILMERAGAGVMAAILSHWPDLAEPDRGASPSGSPGYFQQEEKAARRAVVLCGPGNNGGDGFVVARLLQERGWTVEVLFFGDAVRLPGDARKAYERWCAVGDVVSWDDRAATRARSLEQVDLVVDAVFGIGLTRPMPAELAQMRQVRAARCVAIDLPSGICSDSGKSLNGWRADLSVTFHTVKPGHMLCTPGGRLGGAQACGHVAVVDIGLPDDPVPGAVEMVQRPSSSVMQKAPGHKFSHGHAIVLSGGFGRSGAARLAARGALRIGAGLVTLCVPPSAQMEVATHINALMMRRVADGSELEAVLQDRRINSICLGPGLGLGEVQRDLVAAAVQTGRRVVLDADALTILAGAPDLCAQLHENCILTPHGGEFARLFPKISARLDDDPKGGPAYSKLDATREAANSFGCTVLFKGEDTVIADQTGRCALHAAIRDRAAPGLATAGSGDVLAGFIAGMMARGQNPFEAAGLAAWIHCEAARQFGPGLIAEDLPDMVPCVLRGL